MCEPVKCPKCGTVLPADAPAGLCPKCLVAAGFESEAGSKTNRPKSDPEAPTIDRPSPGTGFLLPSPSVLADKFPQLDIVELLGHGGMGAVYKARQTNLDRHVALKIIRPEATHDPAFAQRFNREAKTLARLGHQHIVGVYDFGEVALPASEDQPARPLYYFIMEYVDGVNLRQLMQSGELTPERALAIVPQICDALQYAHDEGVVHRDIKPENILLDKRGRVKIADFGLAKLATGSAADYTLTGTHQVIGTLRYMSPEQLEGSHAVDHRADIYSLGVVFYEMLTGEAPMGHFEPPSKKVQVDVRLDEVVLRSLAREPERRYQHASDVKTDVESISIPYNAQKPEMPRPFGLDERKPWAWSLLWLGLGMLLPATGLIAFVMYWTGSAWPLLGLGLYWLGFGILVGASSDSIEQDTKNDDGPFTAIAIAAFAASAALMAYGVALVHTLEPLWALGVCVAGFFAGVFAMEVKEGGISTNLSGVKSHHAGRPERLKAPAYGLLAGTLVNWATLMPFALVAMNHSTAYAALLALSITANGLATFGAIQMMRRGSWAWSVAAVPLVGAASLCMVLAMPSLYWALINLPIGIWALVVLLEPGVQRDFVSAANRSDPGRSIWDWGVWLLVPIAFMAVGGKFDVWIPLSGPAFDLVKLLIFISCVGFLVWYFRMKTSGPRTDEDTTPGTRRHSAALNADPHAEPTPQSGLFSLLSQAWNDWWADRAKWFAIAVQSILVLGHLACLAGFFSTTVSNHWQPGGLQRQFTYTVGAFDPWYRFETYPTPNTPFRFGVDVISGSALFLIVGFALYYAVWRIEKARKPKAGWWSSPAPIVIIWAIWSASATTIGMNAGFDALDERRSSDPIAESPNSSRGTGDRE